MLAHKTFQKSVQQEMFTYLQSPQAPNYAHFFRFLTHPSFPLPLPSQKVMFCVTSLFCRLLDHPWLGEHVGLENTSRATGCHRYRYVNLPTGDYGS